jgi:hypothetical protein
VLDRSFSAELQVDAAQWHLYTIAMHPDAALDTFKSI